MPYTMNDWAKKEEALLAVAEVATDGDDSYVAMIRHFMSGAAIEIATVQRTLSANMHTNDGRFTSYPTKLWLECAMKSIKFTDGFEEFLGLDYTTWLKRTSDEFRDILRDTGRLQTAPSIKFYVPHLTGNPNPEWDREGAVDQRYMYADREAAAQWDEVKIYDRSHPYYDCVDTLDDTLKEINPDLSSFDELVILGAGSSDKHWKIIQSISEARLDKRFRIIICDASFHMLVEECDDLLRTSENKGLSNRFDIELYCFDFTRPAGWGICGLGKRARRLVCILGGTIGNVAENYLLNTLKANVMRGGDTLLVGASFYDSEEEMHTRGGADLAKQYGDPDKPTPAKKIVLNAINKTLDREYPDYSMKRRLNSVTHKFLLCDFTTELPSIMKSAIKGTMGIVFTFKLDTGNMVCIDREPCHPLLYLCVSRRYVQSKMMEKLSEFFGATVTAVPHPRGSRYSHLVARVQSNLPQG